MSYQTGNALPAKSVITTNQAALWAMLQIMREGEKLSGLGRPLMGMPAM